MRSISKKVWDEFLDTPIAVLTDYGFESRNVNALEKRYGLYIGSIQKVTEEEFFNVPNFARKTLISLQRAMHKLLVELEQEAEVLHGRR